MNFICVESDLGNESLQHKPKRCIWKINSYNYKIFEIVSSLIFFNLAYSSPIQLPSQQYPYPES